MNKLRDPEANARPGRLPNQSVKAKKKCLRRQRMRSGARLLPYVDDFAVFAHGFDETMRRKSETYALVNSLGLSIHPTKGYHTARQVGEHMGMETDFEKNVSPHQTPVTLKVVGVDPKGYTNSDMMLYIKLKC